MRKFAFFGLIVLFVVFSAASCGKAGAPKAGSAKAESMLNLLPKDSRGVVMIDVHKIMMTEFVDKMIKDPKNAPKYEEFVKTTGIDPQKDVYFVAVGISGEMGGGKEPEPAIVANLKYNKDALLAAIKKEGKDLQEQTYNGVTLYCGSFQKGEEKPGCGAFLDDSNIVIGNDKTVKAVIDVFQKKSESVLKNLQLADVLKNTKKDAMVWSAFLFPPDATKELAAKNPMLGALEGIKSLTLSFDYSDKTFQANIRSSGGDEKKNKSLADMLNGLKALGAGAASKDPNIADLLGRIEVTSGPDHVQISANVPEELIEKLKSTAEQKMKGVMQPPAEEKKEEKKEN
jgi:uncharacterized protein (UPF0212 family)